MFLNIFCFIFVFVYIFEIKRGKIWKVKVFIKIFCFFKFWWMFFIVIGLMVFFLAWGYIFCFLKILVFSLIWIVLSSWLWLWNRVLCCCLGRCCLLVIKLKSVLIVNKMFYKLSGIFVNWRIFWILFLCWMIIMLSVIMCVWRLRKLLMLK